MRKWIVIGVTAAVLVIVVVLALARAAKKREQQEEFSQRREVAVAVEVTRPEVGTIEETKMYLGTVVSTEEATVFSKIPGKVVSVPAKVGARVGAGATVAVIDYDQPGMKFRYYYAYSPLNGEVADVMVSVGDMVSPSTPLAVVVKPESVKLETEVPAETLAVMSRDQPVKIHARGYEGEYVEGEIVNLPRSLSPDSHLAKVEIKPTNKVTALRAGMFAQVEIPVARSDDALLVPPQALRREPEGTAVYVAEGGIVRRRLVELGLAREDAVEVVSGLGADEEVIVYANGDLDDGVKILKKVPYQPHK
ncbi:MAG TPA: efflux RND transporter periplasmic adaptor subunit [bacterium]|nr:efflux RND transporter periplasmic adaptor subunit [bacterium]